MRQPSTQSLGSNTLNLNPFLLSLGLAAALGASQALGGELFSPQVTVKPKGMGGAYTAVAGDHNAPFTNPAGITRIKMARGRGMLHHLQVPNMVVGTNGAGQKLLGLLEGTDSLDASLGTLDKNGAWAVASLSPMAVFQYGSTMITAGWANESILSAVPSAADETLIAINTSLDSTPYLNFAWHDRSNLMSGAIQVRHTQRSATDMTIPIALLADKAAVKAAYNGHTAKTQGLAVDAGVMLTFADFWYPTIGLAVFNLPLSCKKDYLNPYSKTRENVCGTVFTGSSKNPDAVGRVDPTDARIGLAISPRLGRSLGIRMAIDYHHISFSSGDETYGLSKIPISQQLHAGFQIYQGNPLLPAPYALSFGMGQGMVSAGVSANFEGFQIELTTYGHDISFEESPREDRRTLLSISYSG